jgi:predicted HicB family RNase H-like nuclease
MSNLILNFGAVPKSLPIETEKFSGRFVVRMPKSLHQHLSIKAQKEGVSLNQYVIYKLSY